MYLMHFSLKYVGLWIIQFIDFDLVVDLVATASAQEDEVLVRCYLGKAL